MTHILHSKLVRQNSQQKRLRVIVIGIILCLYIAPGVASDTLDIHKNMESTGIVVTASSSEINITALWREIRNVIKSEMLYNLTRDISTNFPNRIWFPNNNTPSENLREAWNWANSTIKQYTSNELYFRQVTEQKALVAIKNGMGPAPRQAIVLTGVIDSRDNPGANEAGFSVAAILESARILQNYSLYCDVYFVLINSARGQLNYDHGAASFVQWLTDNNVEVVASFTYDRLLYYSTSYPEGEKIYIRSLIESDIYQLKDWIPDLMVTYSKSFGTGRIETIDDASYSTKTIAYQMWQKNISAVFTSQGHYFDWASGNDADTIDYNWFNFTKATEAIRSTLGAILVIGNIGSGGYLTQYGTTTLEYGSITTERMVISVQTFINVTIDWTNQTSLYAAILDSEGNIVYFRYENDGHINMKYLAHEKGRYTLIIQNIDNNVTSSSIKIAYQNDCDGDGLWDTYEIKHNLNPYLRDSDRDGLDDDFELAIGSNPLDPDSDGDGASDYDEYIWGSSRTNADTDGDNLTDGVEAILGTSPLLVDTDQDGINDYDEVRIYGTNPLSKDTDGDGLDDAYEITAGLNPLSIDSDGDSLDDMFEILNHLDPTNPDSDGDGWTDAYEVNHCMSPTSLDTDNDLIPDSVDWDPRHHWIDMVAPEIIMTTITLLGVYAWLKRKKYMQIMG